MQDELAQKGEEAISLLDSFSDDLARKDREKWLQGLMADPFYRGLIESGAELGPVPEGPSMTEQEEQEFRALEAKRRTNEQLAVKWGTMTANEVAKQFGLGPSDAETARRVIEDAAAKSSVSGDLTALNKITEALRAMNNFKGQGVTLVPESVLDYSKEIAGIQSLYSVLLKKEREARNPKSTPAGEFGPEEQWLKETMKEGVHGYYQVPLPGEEKLKTRRPWGIGEFVFNWLGVPMPERRP